MLNLYLNLGFITYNFFRVKMDTSYEQVGKVNFFHQGLVVSSNKVKFWDGFWIWWVIFARRLLRLRSLLWTLLVETLAKCQWLWVWVWCHGSGFDVGPSKMDAFFAFCVFCVSLFEMDRKHACFFSTTEKADVFLETNPEARMCL